MLLTMVAVMGGKRMDLRNPWEGKPSECNDQLDERVRKREKSRLLFYNFDHWVKRR